MIRIVLLVLTVTSSIAVADDSSDPLDAHAPGTEPEGYGAAGMGVDVSNGYVFRGVVVDFGHRIARTSWFAHALFQGGTLSRSDDAGHGGLFEARGGIEARRCAVGGMVCGSAGLDLGIHRGEFTPVTYSIRGERLESPPEELDGFVAAPRLTFDGGGRIRFRASLELPLRMREADSVPATTAARVSSEHGTSQFELGFAASLLLAIGF